MSGNTNIADARSLDEIRAEANAYQKNAANPENSAWVSANAGTGKTYVLVLRILRLLLSGAPTESILCLTFTKAAAAEMSNRLLARLAEWAATTDDDLTRELHGLLGRDASAEERHTARCLFARMLDAPGGLKIMTIHAFCDRVLRRFPLEAGVPPSFKVLTDEERSAAIDEAITHILEQGAREPDTALGKALITVVANAGESKFHELISAIIAQSGNLRTLVRAQPTDDPFEGIEARLRATLGVGANDTEISLIAALESVLTDTQITTAIATLNEGKSTDQKLALVLAGARGKSGPDRCAALIEALLTKHLEPRSSRYITKAIRDGHPALAATLDEARDACADLEARRHALAVVLASCALLRLADAVIQHYEEAKLQRNAVDF
nr:UvrD-helicase domain-containing protein [Hyphomicrobiales bacterium]